MAKETRVMVQPVNHYYENVYSASQMLVSWSFRWYVERMAQKDGNGINAKCGYCFTAVAVAVAAAAAAAGDDWLLLPLACI